MLSCRREVIVVIGGAAGNLQDGAPAPPELLGQILSTRQRDRQWQAMLRGVPEEQLAGQPLAWRMGFSGAFSSSALPSRVECSFV